MAQEACWELQVWRGEAMKCAGVTGDRKEALKQQSSSEDCGQFGHGRAEGGSRTGMGGGGWHDLEKRGRAQSSQGFI